MQPKPGRARVALICRRAPGVGRPQRGGVPLLGRFQLCSSARRAGDGAKPRKDGAQVGAGGGPAVAKGGGGCCWIPLCPITGGRLACPCGCFRGGADIPQFCV